jgi:hypothetical protein
MLLAPVCYVHDMGFHLLRSTSLVCMFMKIFACRKGTCITFQVLLSREESLFFITPFVLFYLGKKIRAPGAFLARQLTLVLY